MSCPLREKSQLFDFKKNLNILKRVRRRCASNFFREIISSSAGDNGSGIIEFEGRAAWFSAALPLLSE